MQAIIELTGNPGAGKTVLANVLGEELSPQSILFIDASIDQRLTLMLSPNAPELTLAGLFQQESKAVGSREAIDWVFHDLTVSVGAENDLLVLANLPEEMSEANREKLRYGLTRLIEEYDYVIVDGYHALLHALLPEESIRTVMVLRPGDFASWQSQRAPGVLRQHCLILNGYRDEPLPPLLEGALAERRLQLIGKLPLYASSEECARQLPEDLKDCLLRLDIPFNPQRSL